MLILQSSGILPSIVTLLRISVNELVDSTVPEHLPGLY